MISDNARSGMQQAPARSLFNALGFTAEELKKPMVGIVSSYNEIVPRHMNIDKIVNAVKLGVAEAGGVPVVFPSESSDRICIRRTDACRTCAGKEEKSFFHV